MQHFVIAAVAVLGLAACDNSASSSKPATGTTAAASESPKAEAPRQSAPKHPWGAFKPGSYAKYKTTSEMEIAGTKNKTETEMKQTLLEVTADEAIVEMEMSVAGNVNKVKTPMPLKAPAGKAADGPKPKTGSEEIKAGGKSYKCTWTEMETEANGNKTVTKVWSSEDVPGFMVKSESKTSGTMSMVSTTELVESAAK